MKWKRLCLVLLLMSLCVGCSGMMSQKTVATLYNPDGSKMADLFNNKSYNGVTWSFKSPDGTEVKYFAEEVNSASVAKEAMEAQKALANTLGKLVGLGVPVQ